MKLIMKIFLRGFFLFTIYCRKSAYECIEKCIHNRVAYRHVLFIALLMVMIQPQGPKV